MFSSVQLLLLSFKLVSYLFEFQKKMLFTTTCRVNLVGEHFSLVKLSKAKKLRDNGV